MTALMRTVRRQRAQTLDELAAVTGLTKSYLSKVERGRSTPSVSAAIKIARALDVDVARLFSDDPTAASLTVERAADHAGGRSHAIAATMLGKAMAPFVVRPGTRFTTHPHAAASGHATHPGQEFLFVHRGRVELDLQSSTIYGLLGWNVRRGDLWRIWQRPTTIGAVAARLAGSTP